MVVEVAVAVVLVVSMMMSQCGRSVVDSLEPEEQYSSKDKEAQHLLESLVLLSVLSQQ